MRPAAEEEIPAACEVMFDALQIEVRLREIVDDPRMTTYVALLEEDIVGGITVRWEAEAEIELLAVHRDLRGKGIGQALVRHIIDEARARKVQRLLVGTASFSLDNIFFYQKC